MSTSGLKRNRARQVSDFDTDLVDTGEALQALVAGTLGAPEPGGRRARRRARAKDMAKKGFLLPLLAAQGCLAVGKDDLPIAGATPPGRDNPEGSNGGAIPGNTGTGDAGAGGGGTGGGETGSGTDSGDGGTTTDAFAQPDEFQSVHNQTLQLDPADLLANDSPNGPEGLELVRVFNAVNGTVVFDGAIIEFAPHEGHSGLASFQYEVRDAEGNLSTAIVEVTVAENHDMPVHDDGAHDATHDGAHTHPEDPDKAMEHDIVLNLMPVADATHIAVNSGSWFDPNTWAGGEVPGEGARVLISEGVSVVYDGSSNVSLFTVRVDGAMSFATDVDTFMEVDTFLVSPVGRLTIGTIDNPVAAGVEAVIQIADNGPIDVAWDPQLFSRGLISHGDIQIHGAQKDSFLRLAEDPLKGQTMLVLEEAPDGWAVGDRLVLTGTHLGTKTNNNGDKQIARDVTTEDEELVITRIDGNVVHFAEPLQYDHEGAREDLKAYVANYTRNVRVITENGDDVPVHQRGHVMLMHSDDIDVRYAEFTDLGRTDKSFRAHDVADLDVVNPDSNIKARYSLHIHRAGVADLDDPAMVVGNAVWGSPGWGYVHHDSNAIFSDNAAYDVFGAAFVAETGNETGRWVHNISIKNTGVTGVGWSLNTPKDGDDVNAFDLGRNGTGFYFQGRLVDAVDNVAAGSPGGHGFTYFHRGAADIDVTPDLLGQPETLNYNPSADVNYPAISQFVNNEAFAVGVGVMVIKANSNQRHDQRSFIDDFTAWDVRVGAHLEYTGHYTLRNFDAIAADNIVEPENNYGIGTATSVHDFVVVGATLDGFRYGVKSSSGLHEEVDRSHFYIDVNILGFASTDRHPGAAFEGLASHDTIMSAAEFAALPYDGPVTFESHFEQFGVLENVWAAQDNLTGVKTDSLGEFQIGAIDRHLFGVGMTRYAMAEEGYWTLPDGRAVTSFERYFADRVTGETIKVSTFVEIVEGVGWAETNGGVYRGELDLDGQAPIAVDDEARVAAGNRVVINVLANDSDSDGDPVALDGLSEARHGQAIANDDGTITYLADPGYQGEDEFYYWAEDDNGNFSKAYVHITVDA